MAHASVMPTVMLLSLHARQAAANKCFLLDLLIMVKPKVQGK